MKPFAQLLYFNQVNPALAGIDFRGVRLVEPEDIIEYAGRWDYGEKNAQKLGQKSKMTFYAKPDKPGPPTLYDEGEMMVPIIQKYLAMGHESMIEMGDATFFIECSRVVSHELVRHRMASYQQESQRFTPYGSEPFEDYFFFPPELMNSWHYRFALRYLLKLYLRFINTDGIAKQIARYIFPNAMRTRLIMKANVREWRHICKLRLDKSAQPEMQEVMRQVYDQLVEIYPSSMSGVLDGDRGVR